MELKKKALMIVDDDKEILELLSDFFINHGYETVLAQDGEEATQLLKYKTVNLVVTDVRMPKMNGLNLLKHIKINFKGLPVILMTGYELSKAELSNMAHQADAYITKPFLPEYLLILVKKIIVEVK